MDYKQRKAAFTIGAKLMMDHLNEIKTNSFDELNDIMHIRIHFVEAITEMFTGLWELENRNTKITPTTNPEETAKYFKEFLSDCGVAGREQDLCIRSFYDAVAGMKQDRDIQQGHALISMIVANLRRQGPTEKPN